MEKVATLVKDNLPDFSGHAALYRCTPPLPGNEPWGEGEGQQHHEYVVASASDMYPGPETYLFPANADGKVIDWCEQPGSYKGGLSHAAAFENAGYRIEASLPS